MKVAHIIPKLVTGGAEMMLFKLLAYGNTSSIVITLMDGGAMRTRFEELGVPLVSLGMKRGRLSLSAMSSIRATIRKFNPDIIQGWMYYGNLAAWWAQTVGAGIRAKLFWTIRQTILDGHRHESLLRRTTTKVGALLSGRPEAIVYNSKKSLHQHERFGYRKSRSVYIPNGFDLNKYKPITHPRNGIRAELKIKGRTIVIGQAGRWDPMYKDPDTFLRAAAMFGEKEEDYIFLIAGAGMTPENEQLARMIKELAPDAALLLVGEQHDMLKFYHAIDIFTLASAGEAFPNVVGEAMSCGVPVVVTDAGDCRHIVGKAGIVVPAGNPKRLCEGWTEFLSMTPTSRAKIGKEGRSQVENFYSINSVCQRFEDLYSSTIH